LRKEDNDLELNIHAARAATSENKYGYATREVRRDNRPTKNDRATEKNEIASRWFN